MLFAAGLRYDSMPKPGAAMPGIAGIFTFIFPGEGFSENVSKSLDTRHLFVRSHSFSPSVEGKCAGAAAFESNARSGECAAWKWTIGY
jgi:hypothetical protein